MTSNSIKRIITAQIGGASIPPGYHLVSTRTRQEILLRAAHLKYLTIVRYFNNQVPTDEHGVFGHSKVTLPNREERGAVPYRTMSGKDGDTRQREIGLFDVTDHVWLRHLIIGDKSYDSDALDKRLRQDQGIELISPSRCKRKKAEMGGRFDMICENDSGPLNH